MAQYSRLELALKEAVIIIINKFVIFWCISLARPYLGSG